MPPPKTVNRTKPRTRSPPGFKAGLELMAHLGGIQVKGNGQHPYFYFLPATRTRVGVERCRRCVNKSGETAPCHVQPLTLVGRNLWLSHQCHGCILTPDEDDECSLEGAYYFVNEEQHLVRCDREGVAVDSETFQGRVLEVPLQAMSGPVNSDLGDPITPLSLPIAVVTADTVSGTPVDDIDYPQPDLTQSISSATDEVVFTPPADLDPTSPLWPASEPVPKAWCSAEDPNPDHTSLQPQTRRSRASSYSSNTTEPTPRAPDPLQQLGASGRDTPKVLASLSHNLNKELAALYKIDQEVADLRHTLKTKEGHREAHALKVATYRHAIDDALGALEGEKASLRALLSRFERDVGV